MTSGGTRRNPERARRVRRDAGAVVASETGFMESRRSGIVRKVPTSIAPQTSTPNRLSCLFGRRKGLRAALPSSSRWRRGAEGTRCCALEEQFALARVLRERGRALELRAGLLGAAELGEEVASHARQQVIGSERGLRGQRIDELEARAGTDRHRDGDRAVQLDDGGGRDPGEILVERRDARPVRLRRGARPGVTGG